MLKIVSLFSFIGLTFYGFTQKFEVRDTASLFSCFINGNVSGQIRNFFMATDNEKGLSDYYANAFGGKITYKTAKFKGFQLGVTQSFIFNLTSSDFLKKDPLTNAANRYESTLFDVTDISNKYNLTRLDELYLKYTLKKSSIILGRQYLNTPFLNSQDGRMIPTAFGGLWLESSIKRWNVSGGWLFSASPRGTTNWYSIEKSLGLLSNGINNDGTSAKYLNNIQSEGIGVVQVHRKIGSCWIVNIADYLVENVFNTTLVQIDFSSPKKWFGGIQYIHQNGLNVGGNIDPHLAYFEKNGQSNSFGLKFGRKIKQFSLSLNYNHITKDGRFLLPREWGREPLYTFIQRERSEGLGNSHAIVLKTDFIGKHKTIGVKLYSGAFLTPDVSDFRFNKYGLSSYWHTDLELKYQPTTKIKNFEISILIANKMSIGATYDNPKNVINKVNMFNYNLILNYNF